MNVFDDVILWLCSHWREWISNTQIVKPLKRDRSLSIHCQFHPLQLFFRIYSNRQNNFIARLFYDILSSVSVFQIAVFDLLLNKIPIFVNMFILYNKWNYKRGNKKKNFLWNCKFNFILQKVFSVFLEFPYCAIHKKNT